MNSKERMYAAMSHKPVDRTPVMCQLALGHYFLNCGFAPEECWFDSRCFAKSLVMLQERYNFDGILVNLPGRPENWRQWAKGVEAGRDKKVIEWNNGLVTVVYPDDNPHTFTKGFGSLERADYTSVDINDPSIFRIAGYFCNVFHAPEAWDFAVDADLADAGAYPEWFGAALGEVKELAPEVSVHAEVYSPFTHLMEFFGYEQTLFAMLDKPAVCHSMLEKFTRHVKAELTVYSNYKPDAVLVSSAFAGAGFISRAMYSEFVAPYEKQITDCIRSMGILSYVHTCGAIGDRLELMHGAGYDGIDTLDPPPLGTVDLAAAKREWGDKLFFKGNLNAVDEILNGSEEVFERAVRERLEIGSPGSGYILSSACSVPPRAKGERLARLAEIAKEIGTA